MSAAENPPDIAVLLAHASWVRKLARSLVADPSEADDLVQETWVAALRGGYREDVAPRSWLAAVIKNLAAQRRRGRAARDSRERSAARDEALPDDAELVERAQLEQRLVSLVLELDAPTRQALLLRYYEGLAAEGIATREGVPASTVRNRVARGLERLRAKLDRENGDRERWTHALVLAFAPDATKLVRPGGSTRDVVRGTKTVGATGGALVLTKLLVVASLAIAATTGWIAWRTATTPVEASTTAAQVDPARGARTLATNELAKPQETAERATPLAVVPANVASATNQLAELRGRCVDADGRPVAGVQCELAGSPLPGVDSLAPSWNEVAVQSGAGGVFVMRFDPPKQWHFLVEAWIAGRAPFVRGIEHIAPGEGLDLGDVVLAQPATIAVRVVDSTGAPAVDGWRVSATHPSNGLLWRPLAYQRFSKSIAADGAFHLEDLLAGEWDVQAEHASGAHTEESKVEVAIGQSKSITLRVPGGAESTIRVDVQCRYLPARELSQRSITLRAPGFETRHPVADARGMRAFDFHDVPPGVYTVHIDDPLFEPWSSEPVSPGKTLSARPTPNARLVVRVFDAKGEAFAKPFTLSAERKSADGRTRLSPTQMKGVRDALPSDGFRVLPGRYELSFAGDGIAKASVDVRDLAPGETRVVDVALTSGGRIAGVVALSDGSSAPSGTSVILFAPARIDDSPASEYLVPPPGTMIPGQDRSRHAIATTACDASGRFAFETLGEGAYVVRAQAGVGVATAIGPIALAKDETKEDVRVELPATGAVEGTIALPDGADESLVKVELRPAKRLTPFDSHERMCLRGGELAPLRAGRFRFDRVGSIDVKLLLVSREAPVSALVWNEGWEEAGVVLDALHVDAGSTLVRSYDLRASMPGRCRATVTVNGAVRKNCVLTATRTDRLFDRENVNARVAEDGAAVLAMIEPGTWKLLVRGDDPPWVYVAAERQVIAPGSLVDLTIDVPTYEHVVSFADAGTHEPLRLTDLSLVHAEGDRVRWTNLSTDENGRISLELSPYRYRILARSARPEDHPDEGFVDWTASGPRPAVIELRAK